MTRRSLASYIDHTLLRPEATENEIDQLCQEAKQYQFAAVCINPFWVKRAAQRLQSTPIKVCTVVGFPLGATTAASKVAEARQVVEDGAEEVDMVLNIGALKSGLRDEVYREIEGVVQAVKDRALVKVIIETALLSDAEKRLACQVIQEAGAHYVKTSTGFLGGGATVHDVRLLKEAVGERLKVKASGGIRNYETALAMIEAGASRLGTSASLAILKGQAGSR